MLVFIYFYFKVPNRHSQTRRCRCQYKVFTKQLMYHIEVVVLYQSMCFGISILWWVLYKLELVLARALKVSNDKIYTYFIIFKTYASHCYRELQSKPKNYLVPRKRKKYLALLEVYCRSTLQVNFEGKETWITKLCIINITCN